MREGKSEDACVNESEDEREGEGEGEDERELLDCLLSEALVIVEDLLQHVDALVRQRRPHRDRLHHPRVPAPRRGGKKISGREKPDD